MAVGGSMILGLLLVACDQRMPPAQPSTPAAGPQGTRSTGPIAFVSDRDGTEWIYLANVDGSGVTPLVVGDEPAWAKDGRQIAFRAGSGGAWAIRVITVDGVGGHFVASGKSPEWSPDGRSLVFENWSGSGAEIEVVTVDGANRRPLYDSGGYGSFTPTWSPDGGRILFSVGTYVGDTGLWIVNADGSDADQFGSGAFFDAWSPSWSPDGAEIAFVTHAGIEVARADGSGRRLRVPGPVQDPDWTSDGQLIYTKGSYPGAMRIFITDGSGERQLIPEATAPTRPSYRDWQAVWLR